MTTPSLFDLRRALRCALLAAPFAVACRSSSTTLEPPKPGSSDGAAAVPLDSAVDAAASVVVAAPDAMVPVDTAEPPIDAPVAQRKKGCNADPPRVTGCGGAEVTLHDSPAACGLPSENGAQIPQHRCTALCAGFATASCHMYKNREGAMGVFCNAADPCMGRTPSDRRPERAGFADSVVDYLALAHEMEALSVAAFRELESDLARWGAPASLRRACRGAARDEARHARAMARLLRRRTPEPPRSKATPSPGFASLRALALYNEREGVVGETWGALIALHQSEHALDDEVRAAMCEIAEQETAHAALSFRIAAWARTQLGGDDVAALDAERTAAFADLRCMSGYRPADDAAPVVGWPTRDASAAMLAAIEPMFG